MHPHLRKMSSTALLREGSHQDRPRHQQTLDRPDSDFVHDTLPSDSGTVGTCPEADEDFPEGDDIAGTSRSSYIDRQLVNLLGIQDSFNDDMLLQNNYDQAPSPIRSRAAK